MFLMYIILLHHILNKSEGLPTTKESKGILKGITNKIKKTSENTITAIDDLENKLNKFKEDLEKTESEIKNKTKEGIKDLKENAKRTVGATFDRTKEAVIGKSEEEK